MQGPAFLKEDQSTWSAGPRPRDNSKKTELWERRTPTRAHMTRSRAIVIIDSNKFSSLKQLLSVTGWVRRFADNCRLPQGSRRNTCMLTAAEMLTAETLWLKQAQDEAFPKREEEGSLSRFNPEKDDEGSLRSDGFLRLADDLSFNTKHPIRLPKDML